MFERLGVETLEDLLYFFPKRYEDRRLMTPIAQLKRGESQTVEGRILARAGRQVWYTKKKVFEAMVEDKTGRLVCVWFNQPYLEPYFQPGRFVVLYGKVDVYRNRLQMVAPEWEIIDPEEAEGLSLNVGCIVPVYPLTKGLSQRYLRRVVKAGLDRYRDEVPDLLPVKLRNLHRLANIRRALNNMHFPESVEEQAEAYRRIAFEEFFLFQVSVMKRRQSLVTQSGVAHQIPSDFIRKFEATLPFSLTQAQRKVMGEMAADMHRPAPMLRLLQGDVGSGKTLVAFFGCLIAVHNCGQASVMAPTEILARQHYETFLELKKGAYPHLRLALLVSQLNRQERERMLKEIQKGDMDLVVGTHALISEAVSFKNLSFAVIDEQHKFGVRQRALLSAKGTNPDVLLMTATPIPRTLQLTLYGDLETSVLDEMPPGRGKVTTELFPLDEAKAAYSKVRTMIQKGGQVFIIYPLIEESDKVEVKAAQVMYKKLAQSEFQGCRLGLVHGQMKRLSADRVIRKFKEKKIDILVATTILEVGVDVPNAQGMVIEHAERFGLSQLHQLRGRIGRGGEDASCLLIAEPVTEEAKDRLKAFLSTTDGFEIAQKDLMIRGPGQYFGRHQHGFSELKIADPVRQIEILELARREARQLIQEDPDLKSGIHALIQRAIEERYPTYLAMTQAG